MILDVRRDNIEENYKKQSDNKNMIYGKAKGIFLLNKYLPDLYPYKKIQIIWFLSKTWSAHGNDSERQFASCFARTALHFCIMFSWNAQTVRIPDT